jgi:hypothetical protein
VELKELDSLLQVQPFSPFAVLGRREARMHTMRKRLVAYYARHPRKALLRAKSTLMDGFSNEYLTNSARAVCPP